MNLIKFFRGPKNTYQGSTTHKDVIYFATDTHELYMNGASYGDPVKSITFSEISNGQDKGKVLATVELSSGKTFADLDTQCYGRAEIDSIITEINSTNTSLGTRMTTAEGRIDTLSAGSNTEGSVAYQIAQIVNENLNGSIDTLNEIASWIINDTTGAAKMAADIETLKTGKVDKVTGKQLSTEDYTTAEKTKLAGIEAGAQVNPTNVSAFTNDSGYATTTYVDTADTTTNTRITNLTGQSGSTYTARSTEDASFIKNATNIQDALNKLDDTSMALTTLLTWQEIIPSPTPVPHVVARMTDGRDSDTAPTGVVTSAWLHLYDAITEPIEFTNNNSKLKFALAGSVPAVYWSSLEDEDVNLFQGFDEPFPVTPGVYYIAGSIDATLLNNVFETV